MKVRLTHHLLAALLGVVFTAELAAQTTTFSYQGELREKGQPASGSFDLVFSLHDAGTGGNQVGSLLTNAAVSIANGRFSVPLNFGTGVFDGTDRWLQIAVRTNGTGAFTPLSPRQALTSVPTALYALTPAGPQGPVGPQGPPGPDGAAGPPGPTGASPFTLADTNAVYLQGNVGIGTLAPREKLEVDGGNIRIQGVDGYDAPGESAYLYLGSTVNYIKSTRALGLNLGTFGVPDVVTVRGQTGNVGIGTTNPVTALHVVGTVTADTFDGAVAASHLTGTIAPANLAPGTITSAMLADGAVGSAQVAEGSIEETDLNPGLANETFWRRDGNAGTTPGTSFLGTKDSQPLELRVNNQRALRLEFPGTASVPNLLGGYSGNSIGSETKGAVIAGGGNASQMNTVGDNSDFSAIGGGYRNLIRNDAISSTIGGGNNNLIQDNATGSTIGGGDYNTVASNSPKGTISGGFYNVIGTNASLSAIAGGGLNRIGYNAQAATISGGSENSIAEHSLHASIVGGSGNTIGEVAVASAIGGGDANLIGVNARYGAIGGGETNRIADDAWHATIGGGSNNVAGGYYPTVGGGQQNQATGTWATVPGGYANEAAAPSSFAAGYRAKAIHAGTFVWADNEEADFASSANDQFLIRAAGGVGINTSHPATALEVIGVVKADGFDGPIAANQISGTISSADIAWIPETITSSMLAPGSVTSNHLAPAAVSRLSTPDGSNPSAVRLTDQGNVGIGTYSPASRLEVAGGIRARGGPPGVLGINDNGYAFFGNGGDTDSGMFSSGNGQLEFYANASERMRLTPEGKVGIGTTSPAETLDINGSIRVRSLPDKAQAEVAQLVVADDQGQLKKTVGLPGGMLQYVTEQELVAPNSSQSFSVSCPDFYTATGGGWYAYRNGTTIHDRDVHAYYNGPFSDGRGWRVGIRNDSASYQNVTVYAICIRIH